MTMKGRSLNDGARMCFVLTMRTCYRMIKMPTHALHARIASTSIFKIQASEMMTDDTRPKVMPITMTAEPLEEDAQMDDGVISGRHGSPILSTQAKFRQPLRIS